MSSTASVRTAACGAARRSGPATGVTSTSSPPTVRASRDSVRRDSSARYKYGVDGAGRPTLAHVADSPLPFGFGSGAPAVTSSGTGSGTALLWVVSEQDGNGAERATPGVRPGSGERAAAVAFAASRSEPRRSSRCRRSTTPTCTSAPATVTSARSGRPSARPLAATPPDVRSDDRRTVVDRDRSTSRRTAGDDRQRDHVDGRLLLPGIPTTPFGTSLAAGDTFSVPLTFTPTGVGRARRRRCT